MSKFIEGKLSESKTLQTMIILVSMIFTVGSASFALSEKIGGLENKISVNESVIKELKNFKDKGDILTKDDGVWFRDMFTEFKSDMKKQIESLNREVISLRLEIVKLRRLNGGE